MTTQIEKNHLYDTGFSYQPNKQAAMNTSRTVSNFDKQNVIPCAAQVQGFISTLNQKKFQLKNLMLERQKLTEISNEQQTKLETQAIRQNYEVEREADLHDLNQRTFEEIESLKREKLRNMEKLLSLKKSLEQRYDQIMEMKKLVSDLQDQNCTMEEQIRQMNRQNEALHDQNNDLDIMGQNLDNELLHMKETFRQTEVRHATADRALNMFKNRIDQTLCGIKNENKQTRRLVANMTEVGDKVKKFRQQKAEYDINSNELSIRNTHIADTNGKLRNDLDKCKGHLMCVMKNNELLSNSLQEFNYVDERVTKIIKKNELKKL